jgi:hypothetical protein
VCDSPDTPSTDDVDLVVVLLTGGMQPRVSAQLPDRGPRMRVETPLLSKQWRHSACSWRGPYTGYRQAHTGNRTGGREREHGA